MMSLRVAFHRGPALLARAGIGHYTADLMDALCRLPDLHVTPLPGEMVANTYRRVKPFFTPRVPVTLAGSTTSGPRPSGGGLQSVLRDACRSAYGSAKQMFQWSMSRQLTPRCHDVYHEPNFPALPSDIPTVLTLHDLSCLLMPEHHPKERVAAFESQFVRALGQASHLIAVSKFVRDQAIRMLGWPAERITAVYHGVRPGLGAMTAEQTLATLTPYGLPRQYLLHVGTIEPRKNLLRLMKAYCRVPDSLRERCPLLLVGGWGWNVHEIADFFESQARHQGVRHLGYLPDEHLAAIYNGARAMVFPSHYEGFGLPCLEMMACGGAVLASTAETIAEIFGAHAHLTHPEDDDGWTFAMARIIADDEWHARLRRDSLAFASRFTWDRCAEETAAVYRRVAGRTELKRAG